MKRSNMNTQTINHSQFRFVYFLFQLIEKTSQSKSFFYCILPTDSNRRWCGKEKDQTSKKYKKCKYSATRHCIKPLAGSIQFKF